MREAWLALAELGVEASLEAAEKEPAVDSLHSAVLNEEELPTRGADATCNCTRGTYPHRLRRTLGRRARLPLIGRSGSGLARP